MQRRGEPEAKTVELAGRPGYNPDMMFSGPPMRRLRFAVVATLLLGGLALSEFPELLQLQDDTSNDFTLLTSRQGSSSTSNAAKFGPAPAAILVGESKTFRAISGLLAPATPGPMLRSPIDYLHLLCVHRT